MEPIVGTLTLFGSQPGRMDFLVKIERLHHVLVNDPESEVTVNGEKVTDAVTLFGKLVAINGTVKACLHPELTRYGAVLKAEFTG